MADETGERERPAKTGPSEQVEGCKKCGCYGGNGWLPRMDDTRYACPVCTRSEVVDVD